MALRNKSMYAILGILNLAPSTGYDIKKYSDKVLSGFWNENFGHIYPTLKMLLQDEMIEIVNSKDNEKKIKYGITARGKQELEAWLTSKTDRQPVRSEFMLKLLFSSDQPRESIIQMIESNKELHMENIANYKVMLSTLDDGVAEVTKERSFFLKSVLRKGLLSSEAAIRWCDETIEELKK